MFRVEGWVWVQARTGVERCDDVDENQTRHVVAYRRLRAQARPGTPRQELSRAHACRRDCVCVCVRAWG